ncbi:MAG: hydrogenase accessory protein HypB [Candidatus Lambdaproteobacteria bacterium RIFOXYD1_FULL_56_27]|uniref:Hydrogenase maturation factor HypB n=1 Tax=Candidatus Lambdaproteobacteria bacterium RIFOXYD2_FULL_56_26 TaxID=1817773 RepID=A0A1F6H052_9PROT|nr:MAG: hydrogenase accessory protein HypB [Candidatus Lambdaproteobacteria bacterium RIFOXYC1_FULL_56_13]OGH03787.1 MAG: hydrogenase accessory protein HypB [Candidatus Lambdaproteobacteria bacterium RIFOXYD2_FULL_56_26]OGH08782.1 MAG: hydrogenase accessory protein HypB [Candidatus Lambdaproteobacteria bacterium RIFOXYD1_FULL_56_27]
MSESTGPTDFGRKELKRFEREFLRYNDRAARLNREFFQVHRILALHLLSCPGAGKTQLLLKTIERIKKRYYINVIDSYGCAGLDAGRYSKAGINALGVKASEEGRLDAKLVGQTILARPLKDKGMVFIEGIGAKAYPMDLDLGETAKVSLFCPTQGEDKPFKFSHRVKGSDLVILTKSDLLPYLSFNKSAFVRALKLVHPKAELIELSAETGEGMDEWIEWIAVQAKKQGD